MWTHCVGLYVYRPTCMACFSNGLVGLRPEVNESEWIHHPYVWSWWICWTSECWSDFSPTPMVNLRAAHGYGQGSLQCSWDKCCVQASKKVHVYLISVNNRPAESNFFFFWPTYGSKIQLTYLWIQNSIDLFMLPKSTGSDRFAVHCNHCGFRI